MGNYILSDPGEAPAAGEAQASFVGRLYCPMARFLSFTKGPGAQVGRRSPRVALLYALSRSEGGARR